MRTGRLLGIECQLSTTLGGIMSTQPHRRNRRSSSTKKSSRSSRNRTNHVASFRKELDRRRTARMAHGCPSLIFPKALPVTSRREDIADAIRDNQVVIIAGETGSGKTTQIPKICLELGRGVDGMIGHTQPRRLAARSVAERIAEELGQPVGESVGYAIRFDDKVAAHTSIKLMTDGILLAELQRDRLLEAYDTIIIDEAHERSLNIDFLLGYLKRLLPRRPDLKVIVTSATIDPERFAEHFASADGVPAPIIEVSGRTYPVDILYRPLEVPDPSNPERSIQRDPLEALGDAAEELARMGAGDILCFFATEREIRDAQEALQQRASSGGPLRAMEFVPLFGRLSNEEQHRVFSPGSRRRVVLATNIAETSLTVPRIHYVIDTGTARISRYSTRTKVQRLPIEPISQASANQRSGRCGRLADGVAIRLYSEQDFLSRPEFSDPEILRTNLASVILQMASLRLGAVEDFPFIAPPEFKAVRDGLLLLHELGALDERADHSSPRLSRVGKLLSRIPLDPRLARMMVAASDHGVLHEVLVIVAAITVQDIRERPQDNEAQAKQLHARFSHPTSDFLSYLALWRYLNELQQALSGNALRKRMKSEFLHYVRFREWRDLYRQLVGIASDLGWEVNRDSGVGSALAELEQASAPGSSPRAGVITAGVTSDQSDHLHQSVLSGLLSHIAARVLESKEFRGARGTTVMIFPGSSVAKRPPEFIMAAELVDTSRLWAREVAKIDPRWAERLGERLLKHQYSDPVWSRRRGAAVCTQKSTLFGVTLVADRTVTYATVDPHAARRMFIEHALIGGEWSTKHRFFHDNVDKLEQASALEDKARRRGIVIDEQVLFDFYDRRLPESVVSAKHFDGWWKKQRSEDPHFLDFDPERLLAEDAQDVSEDAFPDVWRQGSFDFELSYRFEPGAADDGVSVRIPIPLLAGVRGDGFDWLVPGLRAELFQELIKTLPKPLRRSVVPAPNFAQKALSAVEPGEPYHRPVVEVLAERLRGLGGSGIDARDFQPSKLPPHLRVTFAAVDKRGEIIDSDKELSRLQSRCSEKISAALRTTSVRDAHDSGAAASPTQSASKRTKKKPAPGKQRSDSDSSAVFVGWTREGLGDITPVVQRHIDGRDVQMYQAATVVPRRDGDQAASATAPLLELRTYPLEQQATAAMFSTTLQLVLSEVKVNSKQMFKGLPLQQRVAVDNYPHGGPDGLCADATAAATRDAISAHGGPAYTYDSFCALSSAVRAEVPGAVRRMLVEVIPSVTAAVTLQDTLAGDTGDVAVELKEQLDFMFPQHAITVHGVAQLKHVPRYVKAMHMRLEAARRDPDRDLDLCQPIYAVEEQLDAVVAAMPASRRSSKEVRAIRWMIEEFRVSIFAQQLGTAHSVSAQRISKAIAKL